MAVDLVSNRFTPEKGSTDNILYYSNGQLEVLIDESGKVNVVLLSLVRSKHRSIPVFGTTLKRKPQYTARDVADFLLQTRIEFNSQYHSDGWATIKTELGDSYSLLDRGRGYELVEILSIVF